MSDKAASCSGDCATGVTTLVITDAGTTLLGRAGAAVTGAVSGAGAADARLGTDAGSNTVGLAAGTHGFSIPSSASQATCSELSESGEGRVSVIKEDGFA
jgi:hypothetical protein